MKINIDYANLKENVMDYQTKVNKYHDELIQKTGKGNDFVGWYDWVHTYNKDEFQRIKTVANNLKDHCDVFLVCGIGGSYLGARAGIEMIQGMYPERKPEIIFIGNTFSSTYMKQVLNHIQGKEVAMNVISKSGTTTETALAFRILRQFMESKYGRQEASKRIVATTDQSRGILKQLADQEGYETFVIPDDIGGRFSVITPVGLLPMAVAGIDIDEVMIGLQDAYEELSNPSLTSNPAYCYAVARRILNNQGYHAEMLVSYETQLTMVAEWWKQLFGESEGKEGKGLLPCSANFSTDLHSLGQFIQDGSKILFETVLEVEEPMLDMNVPSDAEDLDQMNYLAGKSLDWVNKMACQGTLEAHEKTGHVPNIILQMPDMSAKSFGYMCYFFFKACAMSVYLLDVNPFNQPGVEVYKKNMFRLLGKK